MRQSGIYKITNPNGQAYIGQSVDIERRWKTYRNYGCHGQNLIYESLKQHGSEAHQYVILEECYCDDLDKKESYHKQQFINEHGWKKALFATLNDPPTRAQKKAYNRRRDGLNNRQLELDLKFPTRKIYYTIYQYDLDGNYIRAWDDTRLRYLNMSMLRKINKHLKTKEGNVFGYQWRRHLIKEGIKPYYKCGKKWGESKYKHLFN